MTTVGKSKKSGRPTTIRSADREGCCLSRRGAVVIAGERTGSLRRRSFDRSGSVYTATVHVLPPLCRARSRVRDPVERIAQRVGPISSTIRRPAERVSRRAAHGKRFPLQRPVAAAVDSRSCPAVLVVQATRAVSII